MIDRVTGSSIIPPVKRMIQEYNFHAIQYNDLLGDGHLNEGLSRSKSEEFEWHGNEMEKLGKVLDAIAPGWHNGISN